MEGMVEDFCQLALACVLGGMIGYERQSRRKSAGLRTNILVCLGSCLVMMMSYDIYHQVEGMTNADPARLGAQVVSGIGFLGAGAIMKEGVNITGLTTAACLWVVAGVGLAVGAKFYSEAIMTTILVVITIGTLSHLELRRSKRSSILQVIIRLENNFEHLTAIRACLEEMGITITKIKVREEYNKAVTEQSVIMVADMMLHNGEHRKNVDITMALSALPWVYGVELN